MDRAAFGRHPDDEISEVLCAFNKVQHPDGSFLSRFHDVPERPGNARSGKRELQLRKGEPEGGELFGFDRDQKLPVSAAVDGRRRNVLKARKVVEHALGNALQPIVPVLVGNEGHRENRHVVHIGALDEGADYAGRQFVPSAHHAVGELHERSFLVFAHLELNGDKGSGVFGRRPDVVDAAHLVDDGFQGPHNLCFHFRGFRTRHYGNDGRGRHRGHPARDRMFASFLFLSRSVFHFRGSRCDRSGLLLRVRFSAHF